MENRRRISRRPKDSGADRGVGIAPRVGDGRLAPMRILISPDKFKGSLDAAQAAQSIRDGFAAVFPHAEFDLSPIADGGEGTGAIFMNTLGGEEVRAAAHDALGRPVSAAYTWFPDRKLAVIEMSEASGLWRLAASELNPLIASTYGTGELMADALARGAEALYITLGGSATNDAGIGMAAALGWQFFDGTGNEMTPVPENFGMIHRIAAPKARRMCRVKALSDVNNPLLGSRGATRVYAAQKGADTAKMDILEEALRHVADLCRKHFGSDFRDAPGAGATGGLGFGLLTFCDATIEQGFDAVSELLGLEGRIAQADLVITGEGRLDAQTLHGKGPAEVARIARRHNRPVVAFAGAVTGTFPDFDACIPIADGPLTLDESRSRAAELLRSAAERAAHLIKISL